MKRKILAWSLFGFLLLIAVGVILYPLISSYVNEKNQAIIRSEYMEEVQAADDSALREAWAEAERYNAIRKPIRYSNAAVSEAEESYQELLNLKGNGVMGYVEVPKISVYLPIYHGTEGATLERGVGHLLGSSLPVGGEGTHCVLTGHTGMSNQRLFSTCMSWIRCWPTRSTRSTPWPPMKPPCSARWRGRTSVRSSPARPMASTRIGCWCEVRGSHMKRLRRYQPKRSRFRRPSRSGCGSISKACS